MNRPQWKWILTLSLTAGLAGTYGCSSASSSNNNGGGGGGGGTGSNVASIVVNSGPGAGPPANRPYINGAFASVTVCVPGSTSQCQTIGGILVDTGSPGLRILASALTVSLPQQTIGGAPVVECTPFADGFTWGPVQSADMKIAGEEAKSLPIQVIGSSTFSTVPASCSSHGTAEDSLATLGANGILGVGIFAQDCGSACTVSGSSNPGLYYTCPTATTCAVTTEPVASQVQNPVTLFASDNNGVLIQLPSITGPQTSVSGSLIFGIGTRSNNALGNTTIYTIDPSTGNFTTSFQGVTYVRSGFIDSGSNGLYFLDSSVTGMPTCASPMTAFYCPASTQSFTATNQGATAGSGTVDFQIGNANTLTSSAATAATNQLGGPDSGLFDWGLPFFFGRTVFTAIQGATTPGGSGPFWAY